MELNFRNYNKSINNPLLVPRSKTFSIHRDKSSIFDSPVVIKRPKTVHIYNETKKSDINRSTQDAISESTGNRLTQDISESTGNRLTQDAISESTGNRLTQDISESTGNRLTQDAISESTGNRLTQDSTTSESNCKRKDATTSETTVKRKDVSSSETKRDTINKHEPSNESIEVESSKKSVNGLLKKRESQDKLSVNSIDQRVKTKVFTTSELLNNDSSANLSHVDDSEEETVELTSSTIQSQLKSVLDYNNTTVDTSLINDNEKVSVNHKVNQNQKVNSNINLNATSINIDLDEIVVNQPSSTVDSNANFQNEDLNYQSRIASSPNPDLTYNTSIYQEPAYSSQNLTNIDINFDSRVEDPMHIDKNTINDNLVSYKTCENNRDETTNENTLFDDNLPKLSGILVENGVNKETRKTNIVDLVIEDPELNSIGKAKKKSNSEVALRPKVNNALDSDNSECKIETPVSKFTTKTTKVKQSLAELCSKTNRARNRNIVGLSKKVRIDSLHKLSK